MVVIGISNRNTIGTYIYHYKWLLGHYLLLVVINKSVDKLTLLLNRQANVPIIVVIALDSLCHSLTAGLLWSSVAQKRFDDSQLQIGNIFDLRNWMRVFFVKNRGYCLQVLLALFLGSFIDIDHFIAADSWTLYGARHLSSRPFGHAVPFIVVVVSILKFLFKLSNEIVTLTGIAFFSHQLRDSQRRGLWFWPMGSTPPLSGALVFTIDILMSLLARRYLYPDPLEEQDDHCDDDRTPLSSRRSHPEVFEV